MARKPIGDKHAFPEGEAEAPFADYVAEKRKPGQHRGPSFRMSNEHRVKIQNSNVLNALIQHVDGKREMSASQVSAGLGLLKKVLPDLQSVTIGGDPLAPIVHEHKVDLSVYSVEELQTLRRIIGSKKAA